MELIRKYWAKFKNTKLYKWYKGLPVSVVGVTAFLAIIGILTIIFNWYWSGLGEDPNRHFILSLTKDGDEFIQYTTLYIYLITFGATLFAGLAVFLVFNDWKDQHNANVYSNFGIEALNKLKKLTYSLASFHDLAINLSRVESFSFPNTDKKKEAIENIFNEYIENRQILMKSKAELVHDISFMSRLNNDVNLLRVTLDEIKKIDDQIQKFNIYITSNKSSKLNNQELSELLNSDNLFFMNLSTPLTKNIMNVLKPYIQQ